ncbi:MAG: hypothetical protein R2713_13300 [Ilumatobacteraceae bacterium]
MTDVDGHRTAGGTPLDRPADASPSRSRGRLLFIAVQVVVVITAIAFLVVRLTGDDTAGDAAATAAKTPDSVDIDSVSTETLESLVATYRDDPQFADQMPGVALVLAERHFGEQAYDRAFELYAEIVADDRTQPRQFAVALARIAWIAWLGDQDTDAALARIDESLRIDPANAETIYIKGQMLWCGAGDAPAAVELFEQVLSAPDLTDEVRAQVTADLDVAATGAACR